MLDQPAPPPKPRRPRVDAQRNRERLLDAAKTVLGTGGPDASLDAVAKTAGVGIGTLYRHFPTREALYEAVYRREVETLVTLGERLTEELAPTDALRRWVGANIEFIATKKGVMAALALAAHAPPELMAFSFGSLTGALGRLLQRAVEAGEIRADVTAADLLRTTVGICYMHSGPDWQHTALKMVDVLIDGLRAGTMARPGGDTAGR